MTNVGQQGTGWGRWVVMGRSVAIAPALILQMAIAASAQDLGSDIPERLPLIPPVDAPEDELAQATPVQITEVSLEAEDGDLQIQLETTGGELSPPISNVSGNTLLIAIPNAVLELSDGDELLEFEPAEGIAAVQVTEQAGEQVQIAITGVDAVPTTDISSTATGLTLSVVPGISQAGANDDALQIVVTGEQDGYVVPTATTATRTDSPLEDIPQSIQVIPRQIIDDELATGIEDVLDNVAGVQFQGNDDGRGTRFTIRGFGSFGSPILRDGFRVFNAGNNAAAPEVANIERIEVLRGPASVLYGEADPGGLINIVTEQPLAEPTYTAEVQVGSRGFVSPIIDFSGPLNDDGSVRYRFNALFRQENSFRDLDTKFSRTFFSPVVAWDISDRTSLTAGFEFIADEDPADFGLPALGDGIADIPFDHVVTSNPDDTVDKEYIRVGYTLEHEFSDNWRIRNEFRYVYDEYNFGVIGVPFADVDADGNLFRGLARQFNQRDNYSLYTNVQGDFNTGSIEHNLLFGVDLAREEDFGGGEAGLNPQLNPEWFSTINIFDPDYSFTKPSLDDAPASLRNDSTADRLGIYLQDQIYFLDNLILLAGVRYDSVDQETVSTTRSPSVGLNDVVETEQYDDAVTPRVGLVFQPTDTISLYGSYAQSFTPNSGTDINGSPLEPETGDGFEVGVKADLIPDRLAATLAYFNITRQNVATADPNDPLAIASIATGEQRSQGVELDVSGEILPGWDIITSYAYTDAEITEDNTFEAGNRLPGVAEHSASLWTTYRIQSGDLQGLGFGLGFNFVGNRKGGLDNSFDVDSYFLTSTALFYRRDNWRFQVNIDNLFNINYIESVGAGRTRGIYPGDPLTVRASVSATF